MAHSLGLLCLNTGILWCTVACHFRLLGFLAMREILRQQPHGWLAWLTIPHLRHDAQNPPASVGYSPPGLATKTSTSIELEGLARGSDHREICRRPCHKGAWMIVFRCPFWALKQDSPESQASPFFAGPPVHGRQNAAERSLATERSLGRSRIGLTGLKVFRGLKI